MFKFILISLISSVICQITPVNIYLKDETPVSWGVADGTDLSSITVEADPGYSISVTVPVFVLGTTTTNADYAVIGQPNTSNVLKFIQISERERKFLFQTHMLYGEISAKGSSNFTAIFQRTGELTTTEVIPTTTDNGLPTPNEEDDEELLVHVSGATPDSYKSGNSLKTFKEAVIGMASDYCNIQGFPLNGSITETNIMIRSLVQCPYNWPDFDKCVEIIFSVPVLLLDTAGPEWDGYQMTKKHLEQMWNIYWKKYLNEDLTNYDSPNVALITQYWIIGISITTGVFIILLFVLKFWSPPCSKKKKFEEKNMNFDDQSHVVPPFDSVYDDGFDNDGFDSDYAYDAEEISNFTDNS